MNKCRRRSFAAANLLYAIRASKLALLQRGDGSVQSFTRRRGPALARNRPNGINPRRPKRLADRFARQPPV